MGKKIYFYYYYFAVFVPCGPSRSDNASRLGRRSTWSLPS